MTFVDQSIVPVALPTIQKQLGANTAQLQWCVNAYLLMTAVLVLAGGKLSDRIGHRRTFTWGILIFGVASLLCGLSPYISWLIGARALQGIGAAMMIPASAPLLMSLFPSNERGKAMGINVSISSLFLILGPLIGGYLTQKLSWHWIFWVNLPLAALGLILVFLFIPRSNMGEQKFDGWGFLFFAISSSSLVMGIMQGKDWGWTSFEIVSLFLVCLISAIFLFWREKKARHPFLDLSLFRHPNFRAINISIFATQFTLMITVYWAIFFQDSLDWTPLKGGAVTVLSSCPVLFLSPV
ncbi:MAG: MFS transporter, partial [Chlamydiota bacterium]